MRKDVIAKTIFRSLRKTLIKDFKAHFNFTQWRKSDNVDESGIFFKKLQPYVLSKFPMANIKKMSILILWIVDSNEKYSSLTPKYHKLRSEITSLLYSYNKIKFSKCIKSPESLSLFRYFLEKPEVMSKALKGRSEPKLVQEYERHLDGFKLLCKDAFKKSISH